MECLIFACFIGQGYFTEHDKDFTEVIYILAMNVLKIIMEILKSESRKELLKMEFRKFCEERKRMCKENKSCSVCELYELRGCSGNCLHGCVTKPEIAEQIVQKWTEEHQITKNEDKIKEMFGERCFILEDIYSPFIDKSDIIRGLTEWLNQEYKEPKKESD